MLKLLPVLWLIILLRHELTNLLPVICQPSLLRFGFKAGEIGARVALAALALRSGVRIDKLSSDDSYNHTLLKKKSQHFFLASLLLAAGWTLASHVHILIQVIFPKWTLVRLGRGRRQPLTSDDSYNHTLLKKKS